MLAPVLALTCLVCAHAGLKTRGSAPPSTVASFLTSPAFLDATTDALAGAMKDKLSIANLNDLRAHVTRDFSNIPGIESAATITESQKDAWLTVLKNLKNLTLKSAGNRRLSSLSATAARANITYKFHSFDENEKEGTGSLGSNGAHSVSEVTVIPKPPGFSFTIGSPVAGMYLIGGTLDIQGGDEHHIKGKIRAAFVNLRTTLTGTWEADSADLDSVLHIHLSEMGVNEEWIWKPDPKDPLKQSEGSDSGK